MEPNSVAANLIISELGHAFSEQNFAGAAISKTLGIITYRKAGHLGHLMEAMQSLPDKATEENPENFRNRLVVVLARALPVGIKLVDALFSKVKPHENFVRDLLSSAYAQEAPETAKAIGYLALRPEISVAAVQETIDTMEKDSKNAVANGHAEEHIERIHACIANLKIAVAVKRDLLDMDDPRVQVLKSGSQLSDWCSITEDEMQKRLRQQRDNGNPLFR